MINVKGISRNMKNVVKNYSDAQVKVREATSNDPWGPSSTIMSEIADLTYNVVAFSEIMQMVWKRLNDHGKNWRHVYKALVLLEYLIKTGSEKVAQQCRENIFAIQTLKDFQYIEENKDQGMNVREKSKLLVALLKDDDKLKNERTRALKAKERFAQSMSYMGSSGNLGETLPKSSSSYHESLSSSGGDQSLGATARNPNSELENARPQTLGEEELQLQLALAMSKEEAEQEERVRKNDDLRLQLALTESEKNKALRAMEEKRSAVDELLSLNIMPTVPALPTDPWGHPLSTNKMSPVFGGNGMIASPPHVDKVSKDPWSSAPPQALSAPLVDSKAGGDPWATTPLNQSRPMSAQNDPWSTSLTNSPTNMDPWGSAVSDMTSPVFDSRPMITSASNGSPINDIRKTPENFLGPNSNLVNLDALVSTKTTSAVLPLGGNPFAPSTAASLMANPFQAAKPPPPTINQLRAQNQFSAPFDPSSPLNTSLNLSPQPVIQLAPQQQTNNINLNQGLASFQTQFPQQTQTHNPFAM
ncbi:unnamed protein product [Medioppia subpectinata]|uniref:ENTH domain-containing protein n=1 Tax=Medioppia subpectinata TaxID=1979941 RepID=A0A7R9KK44_9ACAR|nr:unnamed protein product [Medioppia subpectinata]CAG2105169.1 unnamed protein product [Medioppia subpectinata]